MSAIIPASQAGLMDWATPRTERDAYRLCEVVANSGLAPKAYQGRPADVMVAYLFGGPLGLSIFESVRAVAVINGRATLWGDAVKGLCMRTGQLEDQTEEWSEDGSSVTVTVKRRGYSPVSRSFSVDDARRAGLWGKPGPWTQYPRDMILARAKGRAYREAFPDIFSGLLTSDEARDIEEPTPMGEAVREAPAKKTLRGALNLGEREEPTPVQEIVVDPEPEPSAAASSWADENREALPRIERELMAMMSTDGPEAVKEEIRSMPDDVRQAVWDCGMMERLKAAAEVSAARV